MTAQRFVVSAEQLTGMGACLGAMVAGADEHARRMAAIDGLRAFAGIPCIACDNCPPAPRRMQIAEAFRHGTNTGHFGALFIDTERLTVTEGAS